MESMDVDPSSVNRETELNAYMWVQQLSNDTDPLMWWRNTSKSSHTWSWWPDSTWLCLPVLCLLRNSLERLKSLSGDAEVTLKSLFSVPTCHSLQTPHVGLVKKIRRKIVNLGSIICIYPWPDDIEFKCYSCGTIICHNIQMTGTLVSCMWSNRDCNVTSDGWLCVSVFLLSCLTQNTHQGRRTRM